MPAMRCSLDCGSSNEVEDHDGMAAGAGLTIEDEDLSRLTAIARSRTEPANRLERAQMLLAYRDNPHRSLP
jgi:hypothetical protein